MLNGQQFIRKMDEQELSKRIKLHYLSRSVQPISISNSLRANPTKWSNTLKQFVGKMPTNFLSVFDHFVGLALIRLTRRLFHLGPCSLDVICSPKKNTLF